MTQGPLPEGGFQLSLEVHLQLQRLRDHLHLLAVLSEPEDDQSDALVLRRHGLSDCFQYLSDSVDSIIAAAIAFDQPVYRQRAH